MARDYYLAQEQNPLARILFARRSPKGVRFAAAA
jgi:hypothetical protein